MKQAFFAFILGNLLLASCVSSKKYADANQRVNDLNAQVTQLNSKIGENEKLIAELKQANEINSRDAAECRIIAENMRRKKENLDKALAERGTSLEEIDRKAATAVQKFQEAGCHVEYKNSRFFITVPDEFVFQSGSSAIKPKGREALNVVAQVMYDNPGVMCTIVGNTDTIPVQGRSDNWTLSTERANAVVRVLENLYNINPKRLSAAGRSKFNPVAINDTPEGRARNRRIEIIINPRFDRIWDLIEE